MRNHQKLYKLAFLINILFLPQTSWSLNQKEFENVIGQKLDQLTHQEKWKEYVKKKSDHFKKVDWEKPIYVNTVKEDMKIENSTYGIIVSYLQIALKSSMEKVKKLTQATDLFHILFDLDAPASPKKNENYSVRFFKKIPVLADQDYTLKYSNNSSGKLWFQRARQVDDKNEFAFRDILLAVEPVEGGVLYREISLGYVRRWYLRALGAQVRSTLKSELKNSAKVIKCMGESPQIDMKHAKKCKA